MNNDYTSFAKLFNSDTIGNHYQHDIIINDRGFIKPHVLHTVCLKSGYVFDVNMLIDNVFLRETEFNYIHALTLNRQSNKMTYIVRNGHYNPTVVWFDQIKYYINEIVNETHPRNRP